MAVCSVVVFYAHSKSNYIFLIEKYVTLFYNKVKIKHSFSLEDYEFCSI